MAVICSSLQFGRSVRVILTEGWPVLVCLWAKKSVNMLCLPVMPGWFILYRGRHCLRTVWIRLVSLACKGIYRAPSKLLMSGLNFCLRHLSVKNLWHCTVSTNKNKNLLTHCSYMLHNATTRSFFSVRENIRDLCTSVCPGASGHPPGSADTAQEGASSYLPKTQPSLQLILVIDILLAAIKTLRGCD